jgi:hypothetical protein
VLEKRKDLQRPAPGASRGFLIRTGYRPLGR